MQDSLGLERACAKAESLKGMTQTARYSRSIHGKWWQLSLEHLSPARKGLMLLRGIWALTLRHRSASQGFGAGERHDPI